jgi:uncharacterized membrane protein YgcG
VTTTSRAGPVPPGDAFTADQRHEIDKVIKEAERISGRDFSVFVGPADGDSRRAAEALHRALPRPGNSILIHVDPTQRTLQIVTGASVRRTLSNGQVALAAITMQSAFAAGDLVRGLRAGIAQIAELAVPVTSLHTDTP